MSAIGRRESRPVSRISMSLGEDLLTDLDRMVVERGFESRSHAISVILYQSLIEHKCERGNQVTAGIITLFYDNSASGLQKQLADLQFQYIDEVISSLHVHLMHNQTMEVVLVQGPARRLQAIADEMTSRRGVISGKMHLIAALLPQLHPFGGDTKAPIATNTGVPARSPERRPGSAKQFAETTGEAPDGEET
jgi:CopG family transcriptional regulator, nickel-responsive regulator